MEKVNKKINELLSFNQHKLIDVIGNKFFEMI